jgi:DNA-binding transcriptional LysR family regulator
MSRYRPKPELDVDASLNIQRLMHRLDWNLIRTFMVIASERSISRAAARLFLSQPAVSLALKRLEENLGHQLVDRSGAKFNLTTTGEHVLDIAKETYSVLAQLGNVSEGGASDVSGNIRLLVVGQIVSPAYDNFLSSFYSQYPNIGIQIETLRSADIVSAIQQKTATMGVCITKGIPYRLEQKLFMSQRYAFYCGQSHALYGRSDVELEELSSERYVNFTSTQVGDTFLPLNLFREKHGFTGRLSASSDSLSEMLRLIFCGVGYGCLPMQLAEQYVASGDLWLLSPREGFAEVDLQLIWNPEQKFNSAEKTFMSEIIALLERGDFSSATQF